MSDEEAMKLALEALEKSVGAMRGLYGGWRCGDPLRAANEAIKALEEALAKQKQGEPDLIECGNCHEGLADMEHVCKKCLGAGWVNNPKQEQGEPWGACVSGRVFVGALPEHVRKLSEDEGLPIQWLYTTPQQPSTIVRKPLTDEQILADETLRYHFGMNGGAGPVSRKGRAVIAAIEAAHGIKE